MAAAACLATGACNIGTIAGGQASRSGRRHLQANRPASPLPVAFVARMRDARRRKRVVQRSLQHGTLDRGAQPNHSTPPARSAGIGRKYVYCTFWGAAVACTRTVERRAARAATWGFCAVRAACMVIAGRTCRSEATRAAGARIVSSTRQSPTDPLRLGGRRPRIVLLCAPRGSNLGWPRLVASFREAAGAEPASCTLRRLPPAAHATSPARPPHCKPLHGPGAWCCANGSLMEQ